MVQFSILDKENKKECIKFVYPNMLYNRYDILFKDNYELIQIIEDDKKIYIPINIEVYNANIGLYMTKLNDNTFKELVKFIFDNFEVDFIKIRYSLNNYPGLKTINQWSVDLSESEEDYLATLGSETRYHIRRYYKKINKDFSFETKTFEKDDIPKEIVTTYFKFKKETHNREYSITEEEYLENYKVTKAIVLYLNNEIAGMSFVCGVEGSDDVYFENFSYDKKYSKYSLGVTVAYCTIKEMIKEGKKRFYLGGGDYQYKKQLSSVCDTAYDGAIKNPKFNFKRWLFQFGEGEFYYYLRIFGIKIKKMKTKPAFKR